VIVRQWQCCSRAAVTVQIGQSQQPHPMFRSVRGDEVRIETLSGIPHRDLVRRLGQLFGQRSARRFKLVAATPDSVVLDDGQTLSLTRVYR
jgi:hypothetical protein